MGLGDIPTFPMGIHCAMTYTEIEQILSLIDEHKMTVFVELGIDQGGLGALLVARADYMKPYFTYIGVELLERVVNLKFKQTLVNGRGLGKSHQAYYIDCLDAENAKNIIAAARWSSDGGPIMLLCDNGDKPREMSLYYPLMMPGDIIMVHDFGKEITEADLKWLRASEVQGLLSDETLLRAWKRR